MLLLSHKVTAKFNQLKNLFNEIIEKINLKIRLCFADSEKFLVDGGTRLQVILDFVKNSPKKLPSKVGRRSSLTDIIDAVTQRVKEDPSLAETLTKAINAAAVDTSEGDMITRQKRYRAKGGKSTLCGVMYVYCIYM